MSIEGDCRPDAAGLAAIVQHNCDLADARHAGAMSMCAYLLDLREYFRWQRHLALGAIPLKVELSAWITAREAAWELLRAAAEDYLPLVDGADPFDEAAADAALVGSGLVAGAGVGRFGRPLFCLAECLRREQREGIDIVIAGRELARGLTAPPALSRQCRILIRTDAMQRWLWTRFEEWRHHPHSHGFPAAWALHAGVSGAAAERLASSTPDAVASIERMALAEVEPIIEHELSEVAIGAELGEDWEEMLEAVPGRKVELFLRAARDLLADCVRTLPGLIGRDADASIHFWFGNLEGMRRALAPGLYAAYLAWDGGDRGALAEAVAAGAGHWRRQCDRILRHWRTAGPTGLEALAAEPETCAQR